MPCSWREVTWPSRINLCSSAGSIPSIGARSLAETSGPSSVISIFMPAPLLSGCGGLESAATGFPVRSLGDLREGFFHSRSRLAGELGLFGLLQIDRLADLNGHHHARAEMRRALDAIDAFLFQRDREFLVDLAAEGLCTLGDHALDRFGIMALVGRDEGDGVAWLGGDEIGLEHHQPLFTLVEHLNFMRLGLGREGNRRDHGSGYELGKHLGIPSWSTCEHGERGCAAQRCAHAYPNRNPAAIPVELAGTAYRYLFVWRRNAILTIAIRYGKKVARDVGDSRGRVG